MGKILRNCIWISFLYCVLCVPFFTVCAGSAEPQGGRVLKVAFPHVPGWSETYPDGSRRGIVYEWLVEIAKYTGWEYEFVDGANVAESISAMYKGECDLMGGMLKMPDNPEFGGRFFYPKYLMGFNDSVLLYRKDNTQIKSFDLSTLEGKTVGVFDKAKNKIMRLQNILDFNNIKCSLKYYDDDNVFERALENGEVDLLLASDVYAVDVYNIALRFPSEPSYIVAKKSDLALCRQLDEAIEEIYSVNPNFSAELFRKYFPKNSRNSTSFTPEELKFIRQSAPLKIAVVAADNYPFYYFVHGRSKGIVPEIFALLAQNTGLKFEYIEAESYAGAIEMIKLGKADLMGDFIHKNVEGDLRELLVTQDYMSLNSVILRNKDVSLLDSNLSQAAVGGEVFLSPQFPNSRILSFDSYVECLKAVDSGDADYTVMPMSVLEYLYTQDYYTNIIPVVDKFKLYLAVAMNKKADMNLYTVLSKGLVNIPDDQLQAVVSGNTLAAGERKMSVKSFVYSNPILSVAVITCFLGLIGIILGMRAWFRLQNGIAYAKLQQAEEISKVRSEFLSRMSHEIRTPLNAIIGFIHLLKLSGGKKLERENDIAKLDSSAKFLLSLVNDILDVSKLENGKMRLDDKPFKMERLLRQLEDIFAVMAEEKRLALTFDLRLLHGNFIGDELRLKQILTNLLSNACKFTDSGGKVSVFVEETVSAKEEGSASKLHFSVKDDGIGISEEDQKRIFDSFEQVISQRRSGQQGTGLGLAISYLLVKLMGGCLMVKSVPGQGSEFYFNIEAPVYEGALDEADKESGEGKQSALFQGRRILLAEDNELNAEIATALLEMQGAAVDWVLNGQEAVEKFARLAAGSYDVILMDLQMPVKNGLEAAREIRGMERPDAQTIPIIAMTANTLTEDRENAYAAGMNGFVPKPFDVGELYKALGSSLAE